MSVRPGTKTDLQRVKSLVKALLFMEPELTEYAPVIIHHPFTTSGMVGLQDEQGNLRIGNIVESQEDRKQWQQQMAKIIDDTNDLFRLYQMIEKPYVLGFLKFVAPNLSKADFSTILADAWIRSEQPNHDPNLSQSKLLAMFRAADPKILMDAEEQEKLEALADMVTVYRGVHSAKSNGIKAMSWTLDQDIAAWFAGRYGRQGCVYEAKIEKAHICALFLGRNESEVILNPKYLTDITQVQTMERSGMTMEEPM
jgi:hypothetical protein